MIKAGQIFTLNKKLERITVEAVTSNHVRISCLNGGTYEVYPDGSIISCSYMGVKGNRRELTPFMTAHGYQMINLRFYHRQVKIFVHRLVALCYIPNPGNLPMVNHIDENKLNNRVENLEWCDNKYNVNYSLDLNDPTRKRRKSNNLVLSKSNIEKLNNMVKLTKEKVKAMLPNEVIAVPCENAGDGKGTAV